MNRFAVGCFSMPARLAIELLGPLARFGRWGAGVAWVGGEALEKHGGRNGGSGCSCLADEPVQSAVSPSTQYALLSGVLCLSPINPGRPGSGLVVRAGEAGPAFSCSRPWRPCRLFFFLLMLRLHPWRGQRPWIARFVIRFATRHLDISCVAQLNRERSAPLLFFLPLSVFPDLFAPCGETFWPNRP